MKRLLPVCSEYFKIIFLHTKPRVSHIFPPLPGVNFKRSRLGSYHFACLCFAPGGLLILWMVYRCDVSNWSTARTSLWLNRHTSKLIFCWEALCRLPSAQIFVLVDYRKWRLPFLLFELESDSLTYTYFGGCFILVCLSLGNIHHTRAICIPLRAENKSIRRSGCL